MLRPVYRARQLILSLNSKVAAEESALLDEYLSPAQRNLFVALDPRDQRHSFNVFHLLAKQGHAEAPLLQAALLHDVGKAGAGLNIWHRVAIVLLQAFWPAVWQRMIAADGSGWRRPFWMHAHHCELGAQKVAAAGGEPQLVELVRCHQAPGADALAMALHEADEMN